MTPAELSRQVQAAFAVAANYLGHLAGEEASAASLLTRPDTDAMLRQALESGRELAETGIRDAWEGSPHQYLQWLLDDASRSYDSLAVLRAAVRVAFHSAGLQDRAEAVRKAVLEHGAGTALRNRLSAEVAVTASRTQAALAQGSLLVSAGEQAWKTWHCSHSPPDDSTCHWCRFLHGMSIPLNEEFPLGEPADLTGHGRETQPPKAYHGHLEGPPRHPRCRCRLVISTKPPWEVPLPQSLPADAGYLSASAVRAIPEAQYRGLWHFLQAAAHELGQVLDRLRQVVSHGR